MKIAMPEGLADAAQSLGVAITPTTSFDPTVALGALRDQFGADVFDDCFGASDEVELSEEAYQQTFDAFGYDPFGFSLNPFKQAKKIVKKTVIPAMAKNAKTPAQKAAIQKLAKLPLKVDVKKSAVGLAKGVSKGIAVASFVVPGAGPLIGGSALAALGAADKLLSDPKVKNAAQVIKNTQALASLGNVPAQRGAATLAAAAQIRAKTGAAAGVPAIPLRTNAQRAAVAAMVPKTVAKVSPAQVKKLAAKVAAKPPGWWDRVLAVFNLKRG